MQMCTVQYSTVHTCILESTVYGIVVAEAVYANFEIMNWADDTTATAIWANVMREELSGKKRDFSFCHQHYTL